MKDVRTIDEPLQLGKFYLVPHIKIKDDMYGLDYRGMWVPVLGDIHNDPEISKAFSSNIPNHIHFDWRFVTNKLFSRMTTNWLPANIHRVAGKIIAESCIAIATPVLLKRKIVRHFEFPPDACPVLEPIYLGKQTGCRTCPHRGISLAGLAPDDQGNVICPGHGLKVNQQTGLVVRRLAP